MGPSTEAPLPHLSAASSHVNVQTPNCSIMKCVALSRRRQNRACSCGAHPQECLGGRGGRSKRGAPSRTRVTKTATAATTARSGKGLCTYRVVEARLHWGVGRLVWARGRGGGAECEGRQQPTSAPGHTTEQPESQGPDPHTPTHIRTARQRRCTRPEITGGGPTWGRRGGTRPASRKAGSASTHG
jgi:hypothetical protein